MGSTNNTTREDDFHFVGRTRREPLSDAEERELALAIRRGDRQAVNRLVEHNIGFVIMLALEFRNRGVPVEDLISEGGIGLIQAAERFDLAKRVKFLTYAKWWIRKYMLQALEEQSGTVRVPTNQWQRVREREARRRPGSCAAREAGSRETTLTGMYRLSLSQELAGSRGLTWADRLSDDEQDAVDDRMIGAQNEEIVTEALDLLTDRERFIIVRRFGLEGQPSLTLQRLGHLTGLSRERVRQIEERAKSQIRRELLQRHSISRPPECRPVAHPSKENPKSA